MKRLNKLVFTPVFFLALHNINANTQQIKIWNFLLKPVGSPENRMFAVDIDNKCSKETGISRVLFWRGKHFYIEYGSGIMRQGVSAISLAKNCNLEINAKHKVVFRSVSLLNKRFIEIPFFEGLKKYELKQMGTYRNGPALVRELSSRNDNFSISSLEKYHGANSNTYQELLAHIEGYKLLSSYVNYGDFDRIAINNPTYTFVFLKSSEQALVIKLYPKMFDSLSTIMD